MWSCSYSYGAPLGGPSGRWSSANTFKLLSNANKVFTPLLSHVTSYWVKTLWLVGAQQSSRDNKNYKFSSFFVKQPSCNAFWILRILHKICPMRGNRSREDINAFIKSVVNRWDNVVSYLRQQFYLSNTSTSNWRESSFSNSADLPKCLLWRHGPKTCHMTLEISFMHLRC